MDLIQYSFWGEFADVSSLQAKSNWATSEWDLIKSDNREFQKKL
jgi:hypothetical protein